MRPRAPPPIGAFAEVEASRPSGRQAPRMRHVSKRAYRFSRYGSTLMRSQLRVRKYFRTRPLECLGCLQTSRAVRARIVARRATGLRLRCRGAHRVESKTELTLSEELAVARRVAATSLHGPRRDVHAPARRPMIHRVGESQLSSPIAFDGMDPRMLRDIAELFGRSATSR
jgi:hypothetical protein